MRLQTIPKMHLISEKILILYCLSAFSDQGIHCSLEQPEYGNMAKKKAKTLPCAHAVLYLGFSHVRNGFFIRQVADLHADV